MHHGVVLATLLELTIPHEDIPSLLALRLSRVERRLIAERVQILAEHMGSVSLRPPRFETLADSHPLFYVLVYASALIHVKAFHRKRGIPQTASRVTLADVGRSVAVHRRRFGRPGLDPVHWLMLHFTGIRYQIGRLQFEQTVLDGEPVLSIHIPEFCGPLTEPACRESIKRAKAFFARHFPETPYRRAVCWSWLLDGQLAQHLPAGSNIVRFQRMFTPMPGSREDDDLIQRFVFHGTPLHRVVLDHLAGGGHWRTGAGWLPL